ncbi:hypothetical protein [Nannocystis punicea]|uniref:Tellurite resistance protein TerB n=1 Tax=Nannocystis punicea TaxID=2995304 RepID=A0ABY7H8Z0_9BACT|nr:hypothetical protein [Nannocystis poenicansa]WAS95454.1 hypothetical protein O0S08_04775 [Nannocystis poenicansa]
MEVVVNKYYAPALDALPASQRRHFQKRLLALTARANAIENGEDEPMDREALADLGYDLGDSLGISSEELQILLEDVFDESVDSLSSLLEEVRADAWAARAQEALYACPHWVTLRIVDSDLWDEEGAEAMRKQTKRFLDKLAKALALDPATRKRIESDTRALRSSDEDEDDD